MSTFSTTARHGHSCCRA